jgi:hypothetical protein
LASNIRAWLTRIFFKYFNAIEADFLDFGAITPIAIGNDRFGSMGRIS